MMVEDVGINYRDNCIKIEAEAVEGKTPSTMIYSFTEVNFASLHSLSFVQKF